MTYFLAISVFNNQSFRQKDFSLFSLVPLQLYVKCDVILQFFFSDYIHLMFMLVYFDELGYSYNIGMGRTNL